MSIVPWRRCWAVSSSDTVLVLIALNAQVRLVGSSQGAQLEVYTLHSPLNAIQKR